MEFSNSGITGKLGAETISIRFAILKNFACLRVFQPLLPPQAELSWPAGHIVARMRGSSMPLCRTNGAKLALPSTSLRVARSELAEGLRASGKRKREETALFMLRLRRSAPTLNVNGVIHK